MGITYRPRSDLIGRSILNADEQTFICTTNTVGAMGAGIAKEVRDTYPEIYKHYRSLHRRGKLHGSLLSSCPIEGGRRCLLFPTKLNWKDKSPPELIINNLEKLSLNYQNLRIESLAIPPLGMANGWLTSDERYTVMAAIDYYCNEMDIDCTFYTEPSILKYILS